MNIATVLMCPAFVWYGVCKLSLAATDTMNQETNKFNTSTDSALLQSKSSFIRNVLFQPLSETTLAFEKGKEAWKGRLE